MCKGIHVFTDETLIERNIKLMWDDNNSELWIDGFCVLTLPRVTMERMLHVFSEGILNDRSEDRRILV